MSVSILMSLDGFSINLHMTRFTFYPPGSLLDMLSNLTIRHCSRPADRASVEPPDPATDESGKCHSRPRGTRARDERARIAQGVARRSLSPPPTAESLLVPAAAVSRQSI